MMLYGESLQVGHINKSYHADLNTGDLDIVPEAHLIGKNLEIHL